MNIVPSLNTLNEATLTEIAKKWGAETGEKVLIVRNEDVRELTLK
jgi:pyruvate kinase